MGGNSPRLALADFIESRRLEIAAQINKISRILPDSERSSYIDRWLSDQIDFLRGGSGRICEWTALLVNRVREQGGHVGEVLLAVQMVRNTILRACLGKIPGVSDADFYAILLDAEDQALKHIGDLQKEGEQKAKAAESRREQAIADATEHAFLLLTLEGRIVLANASAANLIGIPEDRLLGHDLLSLCDSATATEVRRELRQRGGTTARTFDGNIVSPVRGPVPGQFRAAPVFDESGLKNGIAISISSQVVQPIRRSPLVHAQELQMLATTLGLGFYAIDAACRVVLTNDLGATFMSVGQEDPGTYCSRIPAGTLSECKAYLGNVSPDACTLHHGARQIRRLSGDSRWVEITCLPLRDETGRLTLVAKFLRDITEQRLMEDQLLRQERSSAVSQMAITVAHQLRNPLGVIIGFAEMLSQGVPPDQVPTAVGVVLRNGLRCKEIVRSLLDFGQSATAERVLSDLNALVRDRVQPAYAGAAGERISWRLAASLPMVACVPDQVALVFQHLIDNALWAAKRGVIFETASTGDYVEVRVWDDGPGVPDEYRKHLFEPFFTTRREEGGTGLGLSLSRTVVEEHHGELFLDDTATDGTCFVARLPVDQETTETTGKDTLQEPSLKPGHRLLVVEDDPDQQMLLMMAVQSLGHEVDSASGGLAARDLIERNTYAGAVIDLLLGEGLGGRDLYQELLRTKPALAEKTLFITGDTMKYETRRFLQEAGRPFLEKPFLLADFVSCIERILADPGGTAKGAMSPSSS